MAKVQKIPVGRRPGQRKVELPEEVQVSLQEIAGATKQGLLAFAVGVGLEVFRTLLGEDVHQIVGPKGKHDPDRTCYRHTSEGSSVPLGGRYSFPVIALVRPGNVGPTKAFEAAGFEFLDETQVKGMEALRYVKRG